jgi:peptidoglycan/LPS O-acetylase OafA/YrhL
VEKLRNPYRPDIDGLRAVAVSLVVLYHAFPNQLPGGYVGVDIFFVISGYLITQILARELQEGTFSVARFYERRVRRIFPALLVVLIAVILAGGALLLPLEYQQLGLDAFAAAAFVSNIASLMHSGYFDVASSSKPLLHLWSLGIEEQFYLAWPLILLFVHRLRQPAGLAIAILALFSFLANIWLIGAVPIATFYLPFTRAWELLAGALLALLPRERSSQATANVLSIGGILLIGAAAWLLTPKSHFPGWWALLPVAGTCLIVSSSGAPSNRIVLGSRGFVAVGLISYPLYLWHWPLLVFGDSVIVKNTDLKRGALVALSVLLAWLTYRFVEPIFRRGALNHKKIAGLIGGMIVVGLLGCLIFTDDGFDWRYPREVRDFISKAALIEPRRMSSCMLGNQRELVLDQCIDRNARPLLMVWGDSTAGALVPGLRSLQQARQFGLAQFTTSSCPPLLDDIENMGPENCRRLNEQVLDQVGILHPDIVVLHAIWNPAEEHLKALLRTIGRIREKGAGRIIVLGRVPAWHGGLPRQVFRSYTFHRFLPERLEQPSGQNWTDAFIRERIEPSGAIFISAWDALCRERDCLVRVPNGEGGESIMAFDEVHLTEAGSRFLIRTLEPTLFGP